MWSVWPRRKILPGIWLENLKEEEVFEDLDADGSRVLKFIFR
jgi:hypothetical protein